VDMPQPLASMALGTSKLGLSIACVF